MRRKTPEEIKEQYRMALTAVAALRKIDPALLATKDEEDVRNQNTRLFHQFALQNAENLARKLQAEYAPSDTPWHQRMV